MIGILISLLIEKYGFMKGLSIFVNYQLIQSGTIRLPDVAHPLKYRKGTHDRFTLKEIFFMEEYDIPFALKKDEPLQIVDAGANIGYTSVYFAERYPNANIQAIEPESENFRLLEENTEPYENIHCIKGGIWSKSTTLKVVDMGDGTRGFRVQETQKNDQGGFQAICIEDLMPENGYLDILKLDIEGSEKEVFKGTEHSWLSRIRCLIIELHDRMVPGCSKNVFAALSKYNFHCELKGDNLIFLNQELV